jgi:hypothetical protein
MIKAYIIAYNRYKNETPCCHVQVIIGNIMHVNRIAANYDVAAAPSHRNKHADAAAAAPTCTQLLHDSRGRVMQESLAHDAIMRSALSAHGLLLGVPAV